MEEHPETASQVFMQDGRTSGQVVEPLGVAGEDDSAAAAEEVLIADVEVLLASQTGQTVDVFVRYKVEIEEVTIVDEP